MKVLATIGLAAALRISGAAIAGEPAHKVDKAPVLMTNSEMDKTVAGVTPLADIPTNWDYIRLNPRDQDDVSYGYILPEAACFGTASGIIDHC